MAEVGISATVLAVCLLALQNGCKPEQLVDKFMAAHPAAKVRQVVDVVRRRKQDRAAFRNMADDCYVRAVAATVAEGMERLGLDYVEYWLQVEQELLAKLPTVRRPMKRVKRLHKKKVQKIPARPVKKNVENIKAQPVKKQIRAKSLKTIVNIVKKPAKQRQGSAGSKGLKGSKGSGAPGQKLT